MQEYIVWQDRYETGVALVDDQHRRLIGLINDLFTAMKADRADHPTVRSILEALGEYTERHFADEEAVFARSDYPEKTTHREYHRKMIERTRALKQKFLRVDHFSRRELLQYLRKWWLSHIVAVDMSYVPYVTEADFSGINTDSNKEEGMVSA